MLGWQGLRGWFGTALTGTPNEISPLWFPLSICPPPLASPPSKHLGNNLVITMYVLCNYVINWISNDKIETWKEKKLITRWPLHSGHLWPSWGLLKYVLFVQYHVPLNNKLFHCHCHCLEDIIREQSWQYRMRYRRYRMQYCSHCRGNHERTVLTVPTVPPPQ